MGVALSINVFFMLLVSILIKLSLLTTKVNEIVTVVTTPIFLTRFVTGDGTQQYL